MLPPGMLPSSQASRNLSRHVSGCRAAVQAFCSSMHCGVGGNVSLAVGPLGRQADANMRLSNGAPALCYSYSCSKGAYAGESSTNTAA